jgi:predicted outer membrane repeat protein
MTTSSDARSRILTAARYSGAILLTAAAASAAYAATITVNSFNQIDPGQCTIATAIASINAAADQPGCTHSGTYGTSDTINLAAGTYASTVIDNGTNAYPVINKALVINGNGATLSRTLGAVAPFFRFFEVQSGGLTLTNATLMGGRLTAGGNGGAIFNNSGPLTLSGTTFSGNTAIGGDGGAVYHNSVEAANISNSTFTNNTVLPSGDGGAVYDNSSNGMTLANSVFTGNSAIDGGAVYDNSSGGLTVTSGTFTGNSAQGGDGGAIYDNSSNGLVFNGGSVANNNANPDGDGGAIFDNSTGGLHISGVAFTGNATANGLGGAIFDNSSVTTGPVSNNCFVGNTATGGGGINREFGPSLNAVSNWWGAASGPSGAGPGTGDAVSANVTFLPFLASAPAACGGGPPPPVSNTPVPTISEWALWTMALVLLGGGMWAIRRRR